MPAGRAASDNNACGRVQNVLMAQNAPDTVKIRPTSRSSGSGKKITSSHPAAAIASAATTCQTRSCIRSELRVHNGIRISAAIAGIAVTNPTCDNEYAFSTSRTMVGIQLALALRVLTRQKYASASSKILGSVTCFHTEAFDCRP